MRTLQQHSSGPVGGSSTGAGIGAKVRRHARGRRTLGPCAHLILRPVRCRVKDPRRCRCPDQRSELLDSPLAWSYHQRTTILGPPTPEVCGCHPTVASHLLDLPQGGLWTQIVSDVTGRGQQVPEQTIGASYGDALMAAIGGGLHRKPTGQGQDGPSLRPRTRTPTRPLLRLL